MTKTTNIFINFKPNGMKEQKLKNYLRVGILTLALSFLLTNCEKDDNQTLLGENNSDSEFIQNAFNQIDHNNLIPYDYTVDWSNSTKLYSNEFNKSYYEFPINYISSFNPIALNKLKQKGFYNKYKIIAIENDDNQLDFYAIKFYQKIDISDKSIIDSDVSFTNTESFSGIIQLIDIGNNIVYTKKLDNGKVTEYSPIKQKKKSSSGTFARLDEPDCVVYTTTYYVEYYNIYIDDYDNILYEYAGRQITGYGSETICSTTSGGFPDTEMDSYSPNGEGIYKKIGNKYDTKDNPELAFISEEISNCPDGYFPDANGNCVDSLYDKIDASGLTGKEKCIDNLLTENGNDFIQSLLNNFDGDDSEFDIIIKSASELISPSGGNDKGQTHSPNSNNEIIIEISSSSVSSMSAIETAKTILHEYIHADIYRKLLTEEDKTNPEILNFQDTYNKYKEQFKDELATTAHQTMGYLYVNSMRDALKAFHKNVLKSDYEKYTNYNGHEPTDLFYEALAWRGLKEHNVEAYKDIDLDKIEQLETVELDIDVLTKDCNNAQ
ncbi:MAG: hypothetical protein COZ17_05415 [Flavobacteriaceae bacterium CG_4_10_14_3_um_filter_33_47]|nr:MAG: hypothetical protein COW44_11515 [Flavobacteriaceae bacterium CG17_big_fil_post_rev_8_21_14_2_50_33_15]PIY11901.1 MAG: hypothetical protein COZ17_05415 [Flavobacteriaceae bacterium CG_4_10_14_3_um_filter_33_47]PJB18319.1 MAG: hypothetical protein CO117_08635 [Flavobacteriaceae bacterium CG_4_9_14_3_um_filter_33_16]